MRFVSIVSNNKIAKARGFYNPYSAEFALKGGNAS